MSGYRICPHGASDWKVQERLFGFLWWVDVGRLYYDWSVLEVFPTERAAEAWIEKQLAAEAEEHMRRAEARRRRAHYVPRPYP